MFPSEWSVKLTDRLSGYAASNICSVGAQARDLTGSVLSTLESSLPFATLPPSMSAAILHMIPTLGV